MLYFLTCPNEERWPKIDCIDGKDTCINLKLPLLLFIKINIE